MHRPYSPYWTCDSVVCQYGALTLVCSLMGQLRLFLLLLTTYLSHDCFAEPIGHVFARDSASVLGGFFFRNTGSQVDESESTMKGTHGRSYCQNCVISLLAHCPLMVQHKIIGDGCLCVCVCVHVLRQFKRKKEY